MTSIDSPERSPSPEIGMEESIIITRPSTSYKRPSSPDFKRLISSAAEKLSAPFPPDPQTYLDQETHVVLSIAVGLLLLGWYHSYLSAFLSWLAGQVSSLGAYGSYLPAALWALAAVGWYKLWGMLGVQYVTYEPGRLQRFGSAFHAALWASVPWIEEVVVGLIVLAWAWHLVHYVLRETNSTDPAENGRLD